MQLTYSRARLVVFLAFLALCFLGGGGSRTDIRSLLYLHPAAIICSTLLLLIPGRFDLQLIKAPILLLGSLAALMLLQLIPLPPEIWMALPGRSRFVEAMAAAGLPQPWRPVSLSPDLTLNSLASLVVPLAALVGVASLEKEHLRLLLPILIGVAMLSALIGILQLAGGPGSNFYTYRVTNSNDAVGLFANRNHQAAFLACTFPMLAVWGTTPYDDRRAGAARLWIAAALAIFLVPMILVTASRAGLVLAAVALLLTPLMFIGNRPSFLMPRTKVWSRALRIAPWAIGAGVLIVAILLSRAQALQRLTSEDPFEDARLAALPTLYRMTMDFLPIGTGFGTFDPAYRIYEPHEALNPKYFNHAHNDLIELLITGGILALLTFLAFLAWWGFQSISAFRRSSEFSRTKALRRAGALMILIIMAASLVDYPLRTPLMATIVAIACGWLSQRLPSSSRAGR